MSSLTRRRMPAGRHRSADGLRRVGAVDTIDCAVPMRGARAPSGWPDRPVSEARGVDKAGARSSPAAASESGHLQLARDLVHAAPLAVAAFVTRRCRKCSASCCLSDDG